MTSDQVNESIARLELQSREVKRFLDSIDEKIKRIDPQRKRDGAEEPAQSPAPAEIPEASTARSTARDAEAMWSSTTERRRVAQGVPVERRRPARTVAVPEENAVPWDLDRLAALARRYWIPVAVLLLLTPMLALLLLRPAHPAGRQTLAPAAEGASSAPPATAQASPETKSSAGVSGATALETQRTQTGAGGRAAAPPAGVGDALTTPRPSAAIPEVVTATTTAPPTREADTSAPETHGTEAIAANPSGTRTRADAGPAAVVGTSGSGAGTAPGRGRRFNVSSGVMAGNLLYSVTPGYPKGVVSLFRPQGAVVMQAIISKRGRVQNLRVISGHYLLRGAAKDAVRTWRYRPYLVNGAPVEVATIVSVEFHR